MALLNWAVRADLTAYLTSKQRLKIGEGGSHAYIRRKSIPGRGKSHRQGPNTGEDSKW